MKLIIDNKEDSREWVVTETYSNIAGNESYTVYEEVLKDEPVTPSSFDKDKADDYWCC